MMSRQERRERAEARKVELEEMILGRVADSVDEKTLTPQSLAEAIYGAERLIFQGVRPQEAHVKPAVRARLMPKIYSRYLDILRRNHSEMEKAAAEAVEASLLEASAKLISQCFIKERSIFREDAC